MDQTTSLEELKITAQAFVEARHWQEYHTPKNLVMALTVEASELVEIFQWKTELESQSAALSGAMKDRVEEEMADVLAYLLNLANALDIDVSDAFYKKMAKNAQKYPEGGTASF